MMDEPTGRDNLNAKAVCAGKVPGVMHDDKFCACGDCGFKNHVVTGVTQTGPPEIMNPTKFNVKI
jgi:hypothetical protein